MLKFGKQSSLKKKWEVSLKSSSLFVRSHASKIVLIKKYIFKKYVLKRDSVIGSTIVS
jgi:hypothetical protein